MRFLALALVVALLCAIRARPSAAKVWLCLRKLAQDGVHLARGALVYVAPQTQTAHTSVHEVELAELDAWLDEDQQAQDSTSPPVLKSKAQQK